MTITAAQLEEIRLHPHRIGVLVGKTKLTELHSQWIRDLWEAEEHNGLQAHRGAYKTTAVTEIGVIWWLLFHPDDRIAIIRKPYTEAAKTLGTIKQYFQTEGIRELFRAAHGIYPDFKQCKENSITFIFKSTITKEGNIDAYGVDGSITGNHYEKIHCDDVVTPKDRLSKAERESTKEFMREILTNIIDPGKQVHVVGTPWHKDDLWSILPKPRKYDVDATGILSAEELAKKRETTTPSLFAVNYLLKHEADENAIFTNPEYGPWEFNADKLCFHVDAKYKGTHTAALTIMGRRKDGRLQAIGFTFHENVKEKIEWINDTVRLYRALRGHVEDNPDKGYVADLLSAKKLLMHSYHESINKDIKIQTHLKGQWKNIVWSPETEDEYMLQITEYREAQEPNDAPDSVASLIREAFAENKKSNVLYDL